MARIHGWGPGNERVVCRAPRGKRDAPPFPAGMRLDGVAAPRAFPGPVDGVRLREHGKRSLAPTLEPGNAVILDGLGSHKGGEIREAVEDAEDAFPFPPGRSPDPPPIERPFAKPEASPHKMEAETVEDPSRPAVGPRTTSSRKNSQTVSRTRDMRDVDRKTL